MGSGGSLKWETICITYQSEGFVILTEPKKLRSHEPINALCQVGHPVKIRWNNWKQGDRCRLCTIERRRQEKIKEIKEKASSEGYQWISGEYKDASSRLLFKCPRNHDYDTRWSNWIQGNRCSTCLGFNSTISMVRNSLASEGYKLLSNHFVDTSTIIDYECPRGHNITNPYKAWTSGKRCRQCCFEDRKWSQEEIITLAKEKGYEILSLYTLSEDSLTFRCPVGHVYDSTWSSFKRGYNCQRCGVSKPERYLAELLEKHSIQYTMHDRTVLEGKELDFYIPSLNLAIEYCGLRWHSELFLPSTYHLKKLEWCKSKNVSLITIFEDEWLNRRPQLENFLISKFGVTKLVYARKTSVSKIDSYKAREFINKHHIQKPASHSHYYGLSFGNSLVMVLAIGVHHRSTSRDILVQRVCSAYGVTVVGGLSKLMNFALQNLGLTEIATFADRRYSEGNAYHKVGFKLEEILPPDYSYVKSVRRYSKQSLRLKDHEKALNKTEKELRQEQGYSRIYDCGKLRFRFKR